MNRSNFPEPWMAVTQFATNLENELHKEITEGHPLFSILVRAIAKRINNDDVLFEVDSRTFPFAKVHLMFIGLPENKPEWPFTEVFKTIDDWLSYERKQSG
jgi:hypothetical protein